MKLPIPTFILQMKSEIPLKNFDLFIKDGIVFIRTDENSFLWNKCNYVPLKLNTIAKLDKLTSDLNMLSLVTFTGKYRNSKAKQYLKELKKVRN